MSNPQSVTHAVCAECGKRTKTTKQRISALHGFPFFCCQEHRWAHTAKRRAAERKFLHCVHCGGELKHMSPVGFFDPNKKFCNRLCSSRWQAENRKMQDIIPAPADPATPRESAAERRVRRADAIAAACIMVIPDPFMAVCD